MTRRNNVSWALILTSVYAISIVALQFALGQAMPNMGMGALAVTYFIWPAIVISIIAVHWVLRRLRSGRVLVLIGLILIVSATLIAVHPQVDQLSFQEKMQKIVEFAFGK